MIERVQRYPECGTESVIDMVGPRDPGDYPVVVHAPRGQAEVLPSLPIRHLATGGQSWAGPPLFSGRHDRHPVETPDRGGDADGTDRSPPRGHPPMGRFRHDDQRG